MAKKHSPPTCTFCNKELDAVYENEYLVYCFDATTGTYIENDEVWDMEMRCPYCDHNLKDVFDEGVCNYGRKKGK